MPRKAKPRLYYMNPGTTYPSGLDHDQQTLLYYRFSKDWHIVHPSPWETRETYLQMGDHAGYNVPYLVDLAKSCHAAVFLPFQDGKIPADMAGTLKSFLACGCRVWEFKHDGRFTRLRVLDPKRVLTPQETLERMFYEDGRPRPY